MALAGTEVSDAMLLRTCSVIRASLWTRRCWESGLETSDVRADLVTGELVERRDCLFPVCRSFRLAGRGASMIIASIVDDVDTPEYRRNSSSAGGHPISSRNCSREGLAMRIWASLTRSRSFRPRSGGRSSSFPSTADREGDFSVRILGRRSPDGARSLSQPSYDSTLVGLSVSSDWAGVDLSSPKLASLEPGGLSF